MDRHEQKLWFRAKKYGWGWVPASWQGWLMVSLYVLAVIFIAFLTLPSHMEPLEAGAAIKFTLGAGALTAVMLFISYKKGEKPRWQWGTPPKDKTT